MMEKAEPEVMNKNENINYSNNFGEKITWNQSILNSVIELVENLFQEASTAADSHRCLQMSTMNQKMQLCQREQILISAANDVVGELFRQACDAAKMNVTPDECSQVPGVTEGKSKMVIKQTIVQDDEMMNDTRVTVDEMSGGNPSQSLVRNPEVSKKSLPVLSLLQCNKVSSWQDEKYLRMEEACVTMETRDAGFDGVITLNGAVSDDLKGAVSEVSNGEQQDNGGTKDAQCIMEVEKDGSVLQEGGAKTPSNTLTGQDNACDGFKIHNKSLLPLPEFSGDCEAALVMEDHSCLDLAFLVHEEPLCKIPKLDEQSFGNCDRYCLKHNTDSEFTEVCSEGFSRCYDDNPNCLNEKDLHPTFQPQETEEFLVHSENDDDKSTRGMQPIASGNDTSREELIRSQEMKIEHGFDKSFKKKRDGEDGEPTDMKIAGQDVRQEMQLISTENKENVKEQSPTTSATISPKQSDQIDDGCNSSTEKNNQEVGQIRLQENPVLIEEPVNQDCRVKEEAQPIHDQMVPSLLEEGKSATHENGIHELYTDDDDKGSSIVKQKKVDIDDNSVPSPANNPNEIREQQLMEEAPVVNSDVFHTAPSQSVNENQLVPQSSTPVFQWRHAISYQNQQPASSRPNTVTFDQQSTRVPGSERRPSPLPPCNRKRRIGLSRRQRVSHLHHASHPSCQQTRSSPNREHEE